MDNFAEGCELSKDGKVAKRANLPRMATDGKLIQEDEVAKKDNVTAAVELAEKGNFAEKATSSQRVASPRMASLPRMATPGSRRASQQREEMFISHVNCKKTTQRESQQQHPTGLPIPNMTQTTGQLCCIQGGVTQGAPQDAKGITIKTDFTVEGQLSQNCAVNGVFAREGTHPGQHICKVGNFIAGRQVHCGKQVDHEGSFATNIVLAQGVNSPRTTNSTRTARSPRGQICRVRQLRQGRNFTLR